MTDGYGFIVLLARDQQEESKKAVHQLQEFIFHGIFFRVIDTTAYASLSSSLPCILGIFSAGLLVSLVHMGV